MECSKEEFFLLLKEWKNLSCKIILALSVGDPPLSGIIMARVSGFILDIDEEGEYFAVTTNLDSFGDEDFATIGVQGCVFGWGDEQSIPEGARILSVNQNLEAVLTVETPAGIRITVFALKELS